jgi:hypothetical protein
MPTQASLLYGLQNLRKIYAEDPLLVPHIDAVLKLIKRRIGITENGPAGEVSFNWPWIQGSSASKLLSSQPDKNMNLTKKSLFSYSPLKSLSIHQWALLMP